LELSLDTKYDTGTVSKWIIIRDTDSLRNDTETVSKWIIIIGVPVLLFGKEVGMN